MELALAPFSRATLGVFMAIEKPGILDCPPEDEGFETIGQFYAAIAQATERLSAQLGEQALFSGDPARQVDDSLYYGGAGRIIAVTDLASARRAVAEIVEQGEGLDHQAIFDGDKDMFHPERDQIGHYFRFSEIALGRRYQPGDTPASGPTGEAVDIDWTAVYPMRPNPCATDYPQGSQARAAMEAFNRSYSEFLGLLEECFNGHPTLLAIATGAMYGIKAQMINLMRLDSGDEQTTVGPSFEWVAPTHRRVAGAQITVTAHGPYLVSGHIAVHDAHGALLHSTGTATLCRCGGSRNKPFCDGTHERIGFDGAEQADHASIADRRVAYPAPDGVTIYDDRSRCAHFGQCTDRMPRVFGVSEDAFVDTSAAPGAQIARVTADCPSGALAFALPGHTEPTEYHHTASIHPIVDGPYQVRGGIQVTGADGRAYEIRQCQTLCRCGQSGNKPFCDGSHWYAGFRDPLPPELEHAESFPWNDPRAAERGRQRYAREQATARPRTESTQTESTQTESTQVNM